MKSIRILFLLAFMIGLTPALSISGAYAQQTSGAAAGAATGTADDDAGVRATVGDLVRFEQDQDMIAFYDRMAPDARNLIPRDVWLSWTALSPRLIPTQSPEISDITFDSWVWPANGQTYDVAIVNLVQTGSVAGTDTTTQQPQVLHFVKEDTRWRLLPLFSPWVAEAAVKADGQPFVYTSKFDEPVYAAIDAFWAQNFEVAGLRYQSPSELVSVTLNSQVSSGCGTKSDIVDYGIYYCTLDETVYFSPEFRSQVISAIGEEGWNDVIAHEWGHHIQDLLNVDQTAQPELGNGFYSIEIELQADCMAGMFMQNQFASGQVDQYGLDQAIAITNAAGDAPDTKWDDATAHGTGEQRESSWHNGFDRGFGGCRLNLAAAA